MKKQLLTPIFIALFAISANAQVIYTDVEPDTTIYVPYKDYGDTSSYYYFDIDKNGTLDFFCRARLNYIDGVAPNYTLYVYSVDYLKPINNNFVTLGYFDEGVIIDETRTWWYGCQPTNWKDFYSGLKLIKDNQTYYGWVHLYAFERKYITIKEYAINTIPNQPIRAGEIISTVEEGLNFDWLKISVSDKKLYVEITDTSYKAGEITIYNNSGVLITNKTISENINIVDLNSFSSGVYFVKLNTPKGIFTHKFVISN